MANDIKAAEVRAVGDPAIVCGYDVRAGAYGEVPHACVNAGIVVGDRDDQRS